MALGEKHATLVAQHDSMVKVVNGLFGGKGEAKPGEAGVKDLGAGHASPEAAAAAINAALSF